MPTWKDLSSSTLYTTTNPSAMLCQWRAISLGPPAPPPLFGEEGTAAARAAASASSPSVSMNLMLSLVPLSVSTQATYMSSMVE